mmetsp:Transcript_39126/g.93945  ORF Transcript_39126/g.93945 Transcript_39126/m.93945 type:complete len:660 (+) Transcript_39126:174-2153(+)
MRHRGIFFLALGVAAKQGALLRRPSLATDVGHTWAGSDFLSELQGAGISADADPKVVVHRKKAGGGYKAGSPLYEEQQNTTKNSSDISSSSSKSGPEASQGTAASGSSTATGGCTEPVPKASTATECVVILLCIFFAVYTALMVLRTVNGFSSTAAGERLVQIVKGASATVNLAPMLGLVFIATRLRAIYLAQGDPADYDLPQPWVQTAMQAATWSLLVQLVTALAMPAVASGETTKNDVFAMTLTSLKFAAGFLVNVGAIIVGVGALTMEAPNSVWGDKEPKVSPALECTLILAIQYFTIYAALETGRALVFFANRGEPGSSSRTVEITVSVLEAVAGHAQIAPMFGVLFVAARMRAVESGSEDISADIMQACFYVVAYTLMVLLVGILVLPFALGGECKAGDCESDVVFDTTQPVGTFIFLTLRLVCLTIIFCAGGVIIWTLFSLERSGKQASAAMFAVLTISVAYFVVYAALYLVIGFKQYRTASNGTTSTTLRSAVVTLDAAWISSMFGLMLCVLILAVHMRAKSITHNQGQPQTYAQQAMIVVTFAVLAQMLFTLFLPFVSNGPTVGSPGADFDTGNVSSKGLAILLTVCRYICLVCVFGGAIALVVALFDMNCKNTSEGRIFGSDFVAPVGPVDPDAKGFEMTTVGPVLALLG